MKLAQDAHSRAEQAVYQKLWECAKPLDEVSRIVTIGFGEMGRLVGLSESNARINTRMLIAKLALEEHAGYDCERGTGRTYRVFSYQEILNRRKQAGLIHYQRRTLAVIFVDENGQPIDLIRKPVPGLNLTGGLKVGGAAGINLGPAPGPNLIGKPGIKLEPLYREEFRETERETTTAVRRLLQAQLPTFDDAAAAELWAGCRERVTDVKPEEVAYLFAEKLPAARNKRVHSPNPFLVHAVVKSCTAAAIGAIRQGREVPKEEAPALFDAKDLEEMLSDPNTPAHWREIMLERLKQK